MKNLKLELFNYKKSLNFEQDEVAMIVESHFNNIDNYSEKVIIHSLNEKLNMYKYDTTVVSFLESLNTDLKSYELMYELKHLYKVIESQNNGLVYRQPLNVLHSIINEESSDNDRMGRILNELTMYSWVPEIRTFVANLTNSPSQKQNLLSSGKSESVYTVVQPVTDGYVAYIGESWFKLTDKEIIKCDINAEIEDNGLLRTLNTLTEMLKFANITEDRIDFKISENLILGLPVDSKGVVFINEEKLSKEMTLENLFQSPIIPIVSKPMYNYIIEASNNLDKFMEVDIVKHIYTLANPYLEGYAFNYKGNMYLYRRDARSGNSFFAYESAAELISDIKNEFGYDISYHYENLLSKESLVKKQLEDKEREIRMNIDVLDTNMDKIKANIATLGQNELLEAALTELQDTKKKLTLKLEAVKELKLKDVLTAK